jgi:hypothetical protein
MAGRIASLMTLQSLEIVELLTEVALLAASWQGPGGLSCGIVLRSVGSRRMRLS